MGPTNRVYRVINNVQKPKAMDAQHQYSMRLKNSVSQNCESEEEDLNPALDDPDILSDADEDDDRRYNQQKDFIINSVSSLVTPLCQLIEEDTLQAEQDALKSSPEYPQYYNDIDLISEEEVIDTVENGYETQIEEANVTPFDINKSFYRFQWTPKSTNLILHLWGKHKKDMNGRRKHSDIYNDIARAMKDYELGAREIKSKIQNLTRKYRQELEKTKAGIPVKWRYFERVGALVRKPKEMDLTDNSDTSTSFGQKNYGHRIEASMEDSQQEELQQMLEEQQESEIEEYEAAPPRRTKKYKQSFHIQKSVSERFLEIEKEKLRIESQKLQVMKHIASNLTSFRKSIYEMLCNTKRKDRRDIQFKQK